MNKNMDNLNSEINIINKLDCVYNLLLGEYDNDGNYVISKNIKNELKNLHKIKTGEYDNKVFCTSKLNNDSINFIIVFDKNVTNGDNANACLFLGEQIIKVNGYLVNTLETKISDFSSAMNDIVDKAYDEFNVIIGDEKNIIDEFPCIINKKIEVKNQRNNIMQRTDELLGKLFVGKMTVLNELNSEFTGDIIKKFNEDYEKIKKYFLIEKDYKSLSELLQIEHFSLSGTKENYIEQEKQLNVKMMTILNNFILSTNQILMESNQKSENTFQKISNNLQKMTSNLQKKSKTNINISEKNINNRENNVNINEKDDNDREM